MSGLATGVSFAPYAASGPVADAHSVTVTSIFKEWNVPGLTCALPQAQPGRIRLNHGTALPLLRKALRRIERTIVDHS